MIGSVDQYCGYPVRQSVDPRQEDLERVQNVAELLKVHQKDHRSDGDKKEFVALGKLLHPAVVVARRMGDEVLLLAVLSVEIAYLQWGAYIFGIDYYW